MSRVLTVDQGDYIVQVDSGRTVIDSDILVTGKPYGTAPIVTNTIYVTMDGSDTNDGSAQDPSRACRTISGAVKSPLYQPGTSIKVAAGRYLENNPIVVKPYTSIIGSDLRTTEVEPINKTQDLFHVNSSSYLAQMQFINGRSGIVNPNLDRGAYAVSFPINYKFSFNGDTIGGSSVIKSVTDTSNIVLGMEIESPVIGGIPIFPNNTTVVSIDNSTQISMSSVASTTYASAAFTTGKITVYKSPYVQNCTNQSGPWLYDGTMFIPNQTVQVPLAVGTTNFSDGDITIQVAVSESGNGDITNAIAVGMSINTAPQDQGFFTARTLILANIQFIQEQVLEHIRITYPTTNPVYDPFNSIYDPEKCRRDIRTIIEHVLYDTTFGGNSKSVQAGVAYWNGAVSYISGEESQTNNALDYIKTIVTSIVSAANGLGVVTDLFENTTVNAGSFITGRTYTIVDLSDTDFTLIGAASNNSGIVFVATGKGSGGGTAKFGIPVYTPQLLKNADIAVTPFNNNINIIKSIIVDVANAPTIYYSTGPEFGLDSAELLIQANRLFLQQDVTSFITSQYPTFVYDSAKSERDVGYIIDAISQDILLGGNARTFELGVSYYLDNVSVLTNLETNVCLAAIDELSTALQAIVQNNAYTPSWAPGVSQTIKLEWANGIITVPNIDRNITILKTIIQHGPAHATTMYNKHIGTSLFYATGLSADNVKQSTKVVTSTFISVVGSLAIYNITLDNPAVGIGNNSTLYFGYPTVYPVVETNIPDRWNNRKCDPWGAMGGMLIDGDVVTDNSPVRSFVADAFTQVNQGGRGVRVTNKGYVQLVSVFTIFSSIAVQADNGGIASITNSNANFGTYCMISKGYGPREFSGTIFNPSEFAYNAISNSFEVNQYYPSGFFPYKQQVCIFVPDTQYRPHISLMMEVIPEPSYVNQQGKPGFLTATVTFSTITEGDLTITGIDVSDMFIGQALYLHDQYGSDKDLVTNISYLQPGTIITDLGPQTVYLSKPITQSGGDINNPSFFTLFSCGNAYYTILSSQISNNPTLKSDGTSITKGGLILPVNQITPISQDSSPEIAALEYLGILLQSIVQNSSLHDAPLQSIVPQTINLAYNGLDGGQTASNLIYTGSSTSGGVTTPGTGLIDNIITILKSSDSITPDITSTINKYTDTQIVDHIGITLLSKGTPSKNTGDAAQLILANLEYCVEEIYAYIQKQILNSSYGSNWYQLDYTTAKCRRDVKLISKNIAYDLISGIGANYNSVYSGLSYYSRPGTYHIVQLEDNVTDYSLVPDGSIVNFYQRSYMSASGYLFEYVGAGTNYSALPQVGRLDPNQPNEVNMLDGGKVFFTSTDQNGDFRIGQGLVISQATGVLSGRTFQKSLFAEMTPFILAIEG